MPLIHLSSHRKYDEHEMIIIVVTPTKPMTFVLVNFVDEFWTFDKWSYINMHWPKNSWHHHPMAPRQPTLFC